MSTATDPTQCRDALRYANEIRLTNAHTVRTIQAQRYRSGAAHAAAILRDPQGAELAMRVGALLLAVRSVGATKMLRLLEAAGIGNDRKRLRELTVRQRRALADELEGL